VERLLVIHVSFGTGLQALDPGEAEVVALALETGTKDIGLDNLDACCFACLSGLQPIDTLGLLLTARRDGMIPAVFPVIKAL
jgi:predicted nucleic acid-binding protein